MKEHAAHTPVKKLCPTEKVTVLVGKDKEPVMQDFLSFFYPWKVTKVKVLSIPRANFAKIFHAF